MAEEKIYPWDYAEPELRERIYQDRDKFGRLDPRSPQRLILQADIELGLRELQQKNNERAHEIATKSAHSANWLSKLALLIATIAALISVLFGFSNYFGDKGWQKQQLQVLEDIRTNTAPQNGPRSTVRFE